MANTPVTNCTNTIIPVTPTSVPADGQHAAFKPIHNDGIMYYWYANTAVNGSMVFTNVIRMWNGNVDTIAWEGQGLLLHDGNICTYANSNTYAFFIDWSADTTDIYALVAYDGAGNGVGPYAVWKLPFSSGFNKPVGLPFWTGGAPEAVSFTPTCICAGGAGNTVFVGGNDSEGYPSILAVDKFDETETWTTSWSWTNCLPSATVTWMDCEKDSTQQYASVIDIETETANIGTFILTSNSTTILTANSITTWPIVFLSERDSTGRVLWGHDEKALIADQVNTSNTDYYYTDDAGTSWTWLQHCTNPYVPYGGIEWNGLVLFQLQDVSLNPLGMKMGVLKQSIPCVGQATFPYLTVANTHMDWGGPWIGIVDDSVIFPSSVKISFVSMDIPYGGTFYTVIDSGTLGDANSRCYTISTDGGASWSNTSVTDAHEGWLFRFWNTEEHGYAGGGTFANPLPTFSVANVNYRIVSGQLSPAIRRLGYIDGTLTDSIYFVFTRLWQRGNVPDAIWSFDSWCHDGTNFYVLYSIGYGNDLRCIQIPITNPDEWKYIAVSNPIDGFQYDNIDVPGGYIDIHGCAEMDGYIYTLGGNWDNFFGLLRTTPDGTSWYGIDCPFVSDPSDPPFNIGVYGGTSQGDPDRIWVKVNYPLGWYTYTKEGNWEDVSDMFSDVGDNKMSQILWLGSGGKALFEFYDSTWHRQFRYTSDAGHTWEDIGTTEYADVEGGTTSASFGNNVLIAEMFTPPPDYAYTEQINQFSPADVVANVTSVALLSGPRFGMTDTCIGVLGDGATSPLWHPGLDGWTERSPCIWTTYPGMPEAGMHLVSYTGEGFFSGWSSSNAFTRFTMSGLDGNNHTGNMIMVLLCTGPIDSITSAFLSVDTYYVVYPVGGGFGLRTYSTFQIEYGGGVIFGPSETIDVGGSANLTTALAGVSGDFTITVRYMLNIPATGGQVIWSSLNTSLAIEV